MTRTEALNSAVFGVSGVRLNEDETERVFRDLRLAGFAIVPLTPTQGMVLAALREDETWGLHRAPAEEHWARMIAAYEKEHGDG